MSADLKASCLTLRPAELADVDRLREIETLCFDPTIYGDGQSKRSFRSAIISGTARLIVADHKGRAVGYSLLFFRRTGPSARFYSLAVDPSAQDLGVGHILFDDVVNSLTTLKKPRLILEIREDNERLFKRYQKRGFQEFSRVDGYYPDGAAAIRMDQTFELDRSKA